MEVTFNNVTITVVAENENKAYDLLCETLSDSDNKIEFTTDTFCVEPDGEVRDTTELFGHSDVNERKDA